MNFNSVYNIDCFEGMKKLGDESINLIVCDLPYGITAYKWDKKIDAELLWKEYKRILKKNGSVCFFGTEPFSTEHKYKAKDLYKYDLVWKKNMSTGFAHAKNQPMKDYEIISIFSKGKIGHKGHICEKKRMTYNPQGLRKLEKGVKIYAKNTGLNKKMKLKQKACKQEYTNYPRMILEYKVVRNTLKKHPSQKPIDLLEYLIKTYSNEGDIVLDPCVGSGSSLVASKISGRKYIGFETEEEYYKKAIKWLEE